MPAAHGAPPTYPFLAYFIFKERPRFRGATDQVVSGEARFLGAVPRPVNALDWPFRLWV
jgi:hypothetical protein